MESLKKGEKAFRKVAGVTVRILTFCRLECPVSMFPTRPGVWSGPGVVEHLGPDRTDGSYTRHSNRGDFFANIDATCMGLA